MFSLVKLFTRIAKNKHKKHLKTVACESDHVNGIDFYLLQRVNEIFHMILELNGRIGIGEVAELKQLIHAIVSSNIIKHKKAGYFFPNRTI